jgi:outer membrane receptor for ferrienterochelin and colicin
MAQQSPIEDSAQQTVVVTGSLLPQSEVETAVPVMVLTDEDLHIRGFTSVADALQQLSFSTGSVQGAEYVGGFTQGAKTLSMFGLSSSYVKYLIDGRPMADYPALYNGTDTITSISGIPLELVDHIDILPGGQSSLYGSDAIAGVINIVMKKRLDGPVVDGRYGWYKDGGGQDTRLTLADSFTFGNFNMLAGIEAGKITPVWGYQRDLTEQYFTGGSSAQIAERDYLVFSQTSGDYILQDPNNCANVTDQFGSSIGVQTRPGRGDYCGTTRSGFYTIGNGEEDVQGYVRGTFDINPSLSVYTELLASHTDTKYSVSGGYYSTDIDFGAIYDPNLDDFLTLQHVFSPEEIGNLRGNINLDRAISNAYTATFGGNGAIAASDWHYDVSLTYTRQKLIERTALQFTSAIEDYFAAILGPDLGPDPYVGAFPTFTPDYAAFYAPITPADYASFSGLASSHSRTTDTMLRAQIINSSLFKLPAGDAGLAFVVESGRQDWDYAPDSRFLNGETYAYTSVAGRGDRKRYAATAELRVPLINMLTATGSTRYDNYRVSGQNVDKSTYMLGLELRPINTLLVRGRYGTAFKAPTLSDEFQGESGFYQLVPDYYVCGQNGFTNDNITDCPQYDYYFGSTVGNPALNPITAKVWDAGIIFAPLRRLSMGVSYFHWDINNEVAQEDSDRLLRTEASCLEGTLDISSPTCVNALSQVTRDANGNLDSFITPKVNVANETLEALTANINLQQQIAQYGALALRLDYSNILRHKYQQFPGDDFIDLLRNPFWSQEFKTVVNGSLTWSNERMGVTVYGIRRGSTPNYLATTSPDGYAVEGAGRLGPWTSFSLNFGYALTPAIRLSATVDNVFDRMPPVDRSYPGSTQQPYNYLNYSVLGRQYFVQATFSPGR